MALTPWREVRRAHGMIALATDDASLILEAERPAGGDPLLRDAIARLAPHLAFGDVEARGRFVERLATSGQERVVIGRYTHGATSSAYLVASHAPIDIDDVVAAHLACTGSPFEHLAD